MNFVPNTSQPGLFEPSMLEIKGNYAIIKDEYREEFKARLDQRRQEIAENLNVRKAEAKRKGSHVPLTDEQKKQLSGKYDYDNITTEEYRKFVDDLCAMGVMRDEDKFYIDGSDYIPLEYCFTGSTIKQVPYQHFDLDRGCNLLDYARYQAASREYDPEAKTFVKTWSAMLYERMEDVLKQIG